MYVLNGFVADLRSFVRTHAQLDVDVKLPVAKQNLYGHVRFYSSKDLQYLVEKIVDNFAVINICSYTPGYVSIWLKKQLWTSNVIKEILIFGCQYGSNVDHKGTVVSVNVEECNDLVTRLRIALLKDAIQRLAEVSGCIVGSNGLNILVSKKHNKNNSNLILCGNVICNSTVEGYEQQKKNAIAKMCANRIDSDEYPIDIISKLCRASIVYELLSVRHNKVVNTECNTSSKGGIFIMYNYSRLCQIWAAFEKGVIDNCYKSLPDVNTIDFGLLTGEEEWILILNYLSAYPSVIEDSVKLLPSAIVDVHKLCKFLMEMSSAISLFYHRYHILSDPIPSLLPIMYARLYLVKSLVQVYENVFRLLGIEVVREM